MTTEAPARVPLQSAGPVTAGPLTAGPLTAGPVTARPATGPAARFARVVALGDSVTSGEGVGVITAPERTWAAGLAAAAGAASFANLAQSGATLARVRAEQLPAALAHRPTLATVCVGLNDVVKTSCDTAALSGHVGALVGALRATGSLVLITELHDPTRRFRLPAGLARQLRGRVETLNDAVARAAADDPGVLVVDMAPLAEEPACWAVDRVHPSAHGQRRLSELAAARLGVPIERGGTIPAVPSTLAHARWLAASGLPWLVRRCPEVGPPMAAMAFAALRRPVTRPLPGRRGAGPDRPAAPTAL